jgi:hypothetical protein
VRLLVCYTIFLPDNHQGGSGKWSDHERFIELNGDIKLSDFHKELNSILKKVTTDSSHNWQDTKIVVQKIRVV